MQNIISLTEDAGIFVLIIVILYLVSIWFVTWKNRGNGAWIRHTNVELSKEWSRPDRAFIEHLRSQARIDVLRSLQQIGSVPLDVAAIDDLNALLSMMEAKCMSIAHAPISTIWLVLLVILEALQYLAIPFVYRTNWNEDKFWTAIPKALENTLPNDVDENRYEVLKWLIIAPMIIVGIVFLIMIVTCMISRLFHVLSSYLSEQVSRPIAELTVRMLKGGLELLVLAREPLLEFCVLFAFSGLVMILLHKDSFNSIFGPIALIQFFVHYTLLLSANMPCSIMQWLHNIHYTSFFGPVIDITQILSEDDHMYFSYHINKKHKSIIYNTEVQIFNIQRPVFSSKWTAISGSIKLLIAILYTLTRYEYQLACPFFASCFILLTFLLLCSIKLGPCSFHWVNIARNIALIFSLFGILCGFLNIAMNPVRASAEPTYVPTLVFVLGILIGILLCPFLVIFGHSKFHRSPLRLHPIKLQIVHAYYKLIAHGRSEFLANSLDHHLKNKNKEIEDKREEEGEESDINALLKTSSNFEKLREAQANEVYEQLAADLSVWDTWLQSSAYCCCMMDFQNTSTEAERAVQMCSKKSLAKFCINNNNSTNFTPNMVHLQSDEIKYANSRSNTIDDIDRWMQNAELYVDPSYELELGLKLPFDNYLSFNDSTHRLSRDSKDGVFHEGVSPANFQMLPPHFQIMSSNNNANNNNNQHHNGSLEEENTSTTSSTTTQKTSLHSVSTSTTASPSQQQNTKHTEINTTATNQPPVISNTDIDNGNMVNETSIRNREEEVVDGEGKAEMVGSNEGQNQMGNNNNEMRASPFQVVIESFSSQHHHSASFPTALEYCERPNQPCSDMASSYSSSSFSSHHHRSHPSNHTLSV